MSNYLFDREIETEKYKWEQNTVSWASIAEDEEGLWCLIFYFDNFLINVINIGNITSILDNDKDRAHLAKRQRYFNAIINISFKN